MSERRGKWQKLSSKTVHKNPYYSVREDKVIKPDGTEGFYYVVEDREAVFIVALDNQQNVYLVELHRYTVNDISVEVPAGGIDGQDPLVAAKRELQEETGLTAKNWKELGFVYPLNGIISGKNYIFLATELQSTDKNSQAEEGITNVRKVPLKEALQMIKDGKIRDNETIAALTLGALHLKSMN
jgi:8-oxo-dGTP pyrophosphatase MutT (NUDIX family)